MADFPFLPMSVAAFMADTTHLNAQETGAYTSLLFSAWLRPECALPDDDTKLARLARCNLREWMRIKTAVMAFWHLMDDGLWHQKKLDKVRISVIDRSEKARSSAYAKRLKNNKTPSADAEPTHSERSANQNHNQNKNLDFQGDTSDSAARASASPDGPPRPRLQQLPDSALWAGRLAEYEPWNGKYRWPWGPPPDAVGRRNPSLSDEQIRAWKARRDEATKQKEVVA